MKNILIVISIFLPCILVFGQSQLDIQGSTNSNETVAKIRVNSSGFNNVIALDVFSAPNGEQEFYGVGGSFYGGRSGLNSSSYSGNAINAFSTNGHGVKGISTNTAGVYGSGSIGVTGVSNGNGTGVYGESTTYYGVYGKSNSSTGTRGLSSSGWGVYGKSGSNIGVYGYSTTSVGVQGYSRDLIAVNAISTNGNAIVGTSNNKIAVYGHGETYDFYAAGPGTNYGSPSSKRWKSDIRNIDNSIDKISHLRGVYFNWDEQHGGKHDVGFIAEEVGLVLPEIVIYEGNGIDASGMDYSKITPLLVEATNAIRKEYLERFAKMQSQISQLVAQLSEMGNLQKEVMELRVSLRNQSDRFIDQGAAEK